MAIFIKAPKNKNKCPDNEHYLSPRLILNIQTVRNISAKIF